MMTSFGFAQILEDFDGGMLPPTNYQNGGTGSATIISDPTGAARGNVLRAITTMAGDPWQQSEITFVNGNLDLTTAAKTVSIDWYSVAAFDALIRGDGGGGAPFSAAQAVHPGGGWQTLVFDFNNPQDGSEYLMLFIHNYFSLTIGVYLVDGLAVLILVLQKQLI